MSKIPRPSPRFFRELPITDDEKRAALPQKHEKPVAIKQKENKNKQKQLKTVGIFNAVIPSTSREAAISRGTTGRQSKTLNRSKTESSIKLEHVATRRHGRTTSSQAKKVVNFQPAVHATKTVEVPKGATKLKQKLSFRDNMRHIKFQEPKGEQSSSNLKTKSKTENADNHQLALKTKTAEQLPRIRNKKPLNRSKTESAIDLENVNKRTDINKTSKTREQIHNSDKRKDKQVKSTTSDKRATMPSKKEETIKDGDQFQIKFHSPREEPHSGLKFFGRPRKSPINFNLNLCGPSQSPNGDCDSPDAFLKN